MKRPPSTLWSQAERPDPSVSPYTAAGDRAWDARLLRWDVLGSLGHAQGLLASGLISPAEHRRMRTGLRAALRAVDSGKLLMGRRDEDVHTTVENWLTQRYGAVGEMLHTGRSRNDQVLCDLRLFLKDRLLGVDAAGLLLVDQLLAFARREQRSLLPGYTHTRRAMPSTAGLWAGAFAEGLLDTLATLPALWSQVDSSPLGSAAGYGVPLPLDREAAARALGFARLDQMVTTAQNSRGKVEGAAVFWCVQLGHDLSKLASDIILFSAKEYGYLVLPPAFATGSSIMPHKRNPDVLELTRARAATLEGELAAVLAIRGKLTSGYHRDFQMLKEPLMRSLDRTEEMLSMLARLVGHLTVDRARAASALPGEMLATDEVMRRVEKGEPFRSAYRDVAARLRRGERFQIPAARSLLARRSSTGGAGNPGLPRLARRSRDLRRWSQKERARFAGAMKRLEGGKA